MSDLDAICDSYYGREQSSLNGDARELTMNEVPETRDSLLLQVRDKTNHRAWQEFVDLYRPVVYRVALARGLQHFDAQDLVQTVFIAVAGAIAKWEKSSPPRMRKRPSRYTSIVAALAVASWNSRRRGPRFGVR